jgi:nucleoporin POM152
VGDSHYALNDQRTLSDSRLRWEQEVLARPKAYFKNYNRLSYCLNDVFIPRADHFASQDGSVLFEGLPPFTVHFTIQNLASSETRKEVKEFRAHDWHLHFENYIFSTVGSYLITIDSVTDASSCDEIIEEGTSRSLWVDVAETAMIVPFERRTDVCVGDLLQFQLEGMAPWTIT